MLGSNLISSYRHTHTLESLIAELSNESSQEYESAERRERRLRWINQEGEVKVIYGGTLD